MVRYPPPYLVWWWGSPHFNTRPPSTGGGAKCRARLVRLGPHMGKWPVPPLKRGGNVPLSPSRTPPHPTLTSLPGLIVRLFCQVLPITKLPPALQLPTYNLQVPRIKNNTFPFVALGGLSYVTHDKKETSRLEMNTLNVQQRQMRVGTERGPETGDYQRTGSKSCMRVRYNFGS